MTTIKVIEKGWGLNVVKDGLVYAILINYNYADKTFSTIAMDDNGNDVTLNDELQRIIDDYTKNTILNEI